MKCHNCGKKLKDKELICSTCGYDNTMEEVELPILKDDEKENVNNGLTFEKDSDDKALITVESMNYRKKIFGVTAICGLILAVILLFFLWLYGKNDNGYIANLENALQKYYETQEIKEAELVLEEAKNSAKDVKELQNKTREICNKWMNEYFENDSTNVSAFEEVSQKYEKIFINLNKIVVTFNDENIKLLTDNDLNELLEKRTDLYEDGLVYYKGVEFYNNKDFNQAYEAFLRVNKDNLYYDKANEYEYKIISSILELLKRDIDKLTVNMEELTEEERLKVYDDIYNIILKYDTDVYPNVNLSKVNEYNNLLESYRNM